MKNINNYPKFLESSSSKEEIFIVMMDYDSFSDIEIVFKTEVLAADYIIKWVNSAYKNESGFVEFETFFDENDKSNFSHHDHDFKLTENEGWIHCLRFMNELPKYNEILKIVKTTIYSNPEKVHVYDRHST